MKPITLIQLISEQTMQNLLPVLRLQPSRLVHLATPKTAARSDFILEAARQSGMKPEIETVALSAMPAVAETSNAIAAAIEGAREKGPLPVINFTGGTKLMSIGAFAAALNRQAPSLYVDTQDDCFVDGRTADGLADLLNHDFSFTPLRTTLSVDAVAVAHGKERVTGGLDWRPYLTLARYFFENPDVEQAVHESFFGRGGLIANDRAPRQPEDWRQLLDQRIELPREVARLAIEAKILLPGDGSGTRPPDATRDELDVLIAARRQRKHVPDYDRRRIAATRPIQDAINFLTGGWWEVLVAEAAERSGLFRDIRWSCEVAERGGGSLEEDVLALDGVRVVCISCKRGGHRERLLPLLEEIDARARAIGGNFTRRFLATCHPPRGRTGQNLKRRARELDITLLSRENLYRPNAFVRNST